MHKSWNRGLFRNLAKSQKFSMILSLCSKVQAGVLRLCAILPGRVVAQPTSELACQVYMRVRVESAAEYWAQRAAVICLASSCWLPHSTAAGSQLPSVRDGERPVLVPRGASSRNPTASDPSVNFVPRETSLSARRPHALGRASIPVKPRPTVHRTVSVTWMRLR